jgi:endonuclease YncB( thermonuclease family)
MRDTGGSADRKPAWLKQRPLALVGLLIIAVVIAVFDDGESQDAAGSTSEVTAAAASGDAESAGETVTVTHVVDGDTVDLSSGERVRVIGIDTPERGECGYAAATEYMESLVLGKEVTAVPGARDDRDRYGRSLRYLDVGQTDAGLALITKGYADARYDSRDGYGAHPREYQYVDADTRSADTFVC